MEGMELEDFCLGARWVSEETEGTRTPEHQGRRGFESQRPPPKAQVEGVGRTKDRWVGSSVWRYRDVRGCKNIKDRRSPRTAKDGERD